MCFTSDLRGMTTLDEMILFGGMEYQVETSDEVEAGCSPLDVVGVDTGLSLEDVLEAIRKGRNSDRW